jgi:GNAT superfamily N-acetyltransferase
MTAALRSIRAADGGDADLAAFVEIVNDASPDESTSIDELRWADATYPGAARFLAEVDGGPVGAASVGRIYMYPPEFDGLWASIHVLGPFRNQGIGTGLLEAVSERARSAGKTSLHVPATEERPEGIAFLTRRGFVEYERAKIIRLELAGLTPPAIDMPDGVSLVTLAERPDLVPGVHTVAVEAFADIPGGDEPTAAGDLVEFRVRDVDRPSIPPGAFMIALETATGQVVGYASLLMLPGSTRAAWHDMTAMARAWRGRGLAGALKRATIGWAIGNGLDTLESGNDIDNVAMRAVNARLGYRPIADRLVLRGPAVGAIMDR